jgi:penicillin-binding protein 1A
VQVKTADGKVIYRRPGAGGLGRVIDPNAEAMMLDMMHNTFVIGTARKANIPGWDLAGKTGTSQEFRDAWFIGFSGSLVAGVWLGNDSGEPTKRVSGGNLPTEIWHSFMKVALKDQQPVPLPGGLRFAPPSADGPVASAAQPGYATAQRESGWIPPEPVRQRSQDKNFFEKLFGL